MVNLKEAGEEKSCSFDKVDCQGNSCLEGDCLECCYDLRCCSGNCCFRRCNSKGCFGRSCRAGRCCNRKCCSGGCCFKRSGGALIVLGALVGIGVIIQKLSSK